MIDPAGLDDAGVLTAGRAARARAGARRRRAGRARPRGHARPAVHDHLHVGHDRAAEGLRPHPRQLPRRRLDVRARRDRAGGRRRLPVPPARALVRAADPARGARHGRHARLRRRRPEADHRRALRGPADVPAVGAADLREALHAGHRPRRPGRRSAPRRRSGSRSARCRPRARRCRPSCRRTSTAAEEALFKNVRAAFGGRLRQATSGAAPIATEILEFFFACGVPVLEGYGMTETATAATASTIDNYRFGSVGRPLPGHGGPDRRGRRGAAQGPEHLPGLLPQRRRLVRRDRRRLDAHGRPRARRRRRLPVHHRPQEGHHHHGRRQEPHAGQPRERPQAVALDLPGGHARRPPPLPGRADHPRSGGDRASSPASTACRRIRRRCRASRR